MAVIRSAALGALMLAAVAACGSGGTGHGSGHAAQGRPPGLSRDGSLDVSCAVGGTPNTASYRATVTFYNPGTTRQSVSSFNLTWNGESTNDISGSLSVPAGAWYVPAGQSITVPVSAPSYYSSCKIGTWSP